MKTNIIIVLLLPVIFFSCASSPEYLPDPDDLNTGIYGSYISVTLFDGEEINGELISVDESSFMVLSDKNKIIKVIPPEKVSDFKVKYAKGRDYAYTIPVFAVLSLAHGFYAAITLPVNLIVTIAVTVSGENAFTYDRMEISMDDLKMFARFPQGIPPGVELKNIR